MSAGVVSGAVTALLLALFVGAWIWAWSARRQPGFAAASRLPLDEDETEVRQ